MRDPSADPTPLDRASFYIEALKFGPGPGAVELLTNEDIAGQLETLLRDAGVTSMSGEELWHASTYYGQSFASTLSCRIGIPLSIWVDGMMHGLALAGKIEGEHRVAKGQ